MDPQFKYIFIFEIYIYINFGVPNGAQIFLRGPRQFWQSKVSIPGEIMLGVILYNYSSRNRSYLYKSVARENYIIEPPQL